MNFRYKLMQFMSGRYGFDTLFNILITLAAVIAVVNTFARLLILQFVVYILVIIAFLRVLSRNTEARAKENNVATNLIYTVSNKLKNYKKRKADTLHVYKKCPNCKAVLRLPRKKGKHKTVCPKCKTCFTVRIIK